MQSHITYILHRPGQHTLLVMEAGESTVCGVIDPEPRAPHYVKVNASIVLEFFKTPSRPKILT